LAILPSVSSIEYEAITYSNLNSPRELFHSRGSSVGFFKSLSCFFMFNEYDVQNILVLNSQKILFSGFVNEWTYRLKSFYKL